MNFVLYNFKMFSPNVGGITFQVVLTIYSSCYCCLHFTIFALTICFSFFNIYSIEMIAKKTTATATTNKKFP